MTDTEAGASAEAAASRPAETAAPEFEFGAAPPPTPTAPPVAAPPVTQALIDAVTQLEANRRDLSPTGFQRRLQLAYAVFDQATLMVQEIEGQHAKLLSDLLSVERRAPLPPTIGPRPAGGDAS